MMASGIAGIPVDANIPGEVVTDVLRPLSEDGSFSDAIERYETQILKNAIKRHGKISVVVDQLQISRSTLDMKRKKYGLVEE